MKLSPPLLSGVWATHVTLGAHCTSPGLSLEGCRDTQSTKSWHTTQGKNLLKTKLPNLFISSAVDLSQLKIRVLEHPTAVPCPLKMNHRRIINFNFLNSYSKYLMECIYMHLVWHAFTQYLLPYSVAMPEFSPTLSHQIELARYNIQPCSTCFSVQ